MVSYLDHIRRCTAHDMADFVPFRLGRTVIGHVRRRLLGPLRDYPDVVSVYEDGVMLSPALDGFAARTEAVGAMAARLAEQGHVARLRGEMYPVIETVGAPPLFDIDRGVTTEFGIVNRGFHLNGLVRRDGADFMWLATRALDKTTYPGKLDNLVAGGHPSGLSAEQNLIKECAEEAGIDEPLARTARPVSVMTYCMEVEAGLRRHAMFAYDLDLPATFEPVAVDGEAHAFSLHPAEAVAEIEVSDLDAFKYNCNLVVIDWLVRTGRLGPDDPDYVAIATGLRTPLP